MCEKSHTWGVLVKQHVCSELIFFDSLTISYNNHKYRNVIAKGPWILKKILTFAMFKQAW